MTAQAPSNAMFILGEKQRNVLLSAADALEYGNNLAILAMMVRDIANGKQPAHEPVDGIEQRLTALRNEIASDLHSRAAAVIRAYASDAGEDHTVGICTCSDMRLADELDAAGASQPPPPEHGINGLRYDVSGWVCSVCHGWNHACEQQCTHTHAMTGLTKEVGQ